MLLASGEPFAAAAAPPLTFRNTTFNVPGHLLSGGRTFQISVEQRKKSPSVDRTSGLVALYVAFRAQFLPFLAALGWLCVGMPR